MKPPGSRTSDVQTGAVVGGGVATSPAEVGDPVPATGQLGVC